MNNKHDGEFSFSPKIDEPTTKQQSKKRPVTYEDFDKAMADLEFYLNDMLQPIETNTISRDFNCHITDESIDLIARKVASKITKVIVIFVLFFSIIYYYTT